MIRELRRRHRRIFFVLAIALPILVFIGFKSRKEIPAMDKLPVGSSAFEIRHSAFPP